MNATSKSTTERPIQNGDTKQERSNTKNSNGLYRRILYGADFLPGSTRVFKHALRLAKQNNAELLILHAYDLPRTVGFMPADCFEEWLNGYKAHSTEQAKCFIDEARKEGVHAHAVTREGLPEDAIARAVKKVKIDLVVIGTHARRGLLRCLSGGSVAARIIPRADCAVLTVRRDDDPNL